MNRPRAALAALLAAALLTACHDDPEPKLADPSPTPSSGSAEPSVSDTPSARSTPEDTIVEWVAAQNEALRTGATDAMRGLGTTRCRGCDDFAAPIEEVYAAGGSFAGGAWKLVSTHREAVAGGTATMTAAVRVAAGTTIPEAGATPVDYAAQSHLVKFELVQEGDSWRFSVIAFVS